MDQRLTEVTFGVTINVLRKLLLKVMMPNYGYIVPFVIVGHS